jgi:magnesium chelatase family protein
VCQALEDKEVSIAREQGTVVYPASFLLIASLRPCPCGFFFDPIKACTCSATAIARYQKRMHSRLLDHIDLHIEVPRVDYEKLADKRKVETSAVVRRRVQAACKWQLRRLADTKLTCNAEMGPTEVRKFCQTDPAEREAAQGSATATASFRSCASSRSQAGTHDSRPGRKQTDES